MSNSRNPQDYIGDLKSVELLSSDEIAQLQEGRIRELLKHAYTNSRFYKALYDDKGITFDKLDSVDFKTVPIVDKPQLMGAFDDVVTSEELKKTDLDVFIANKENRGKKYGDSHRVLHTSGTSGVIGVYVYSLSEWALTEAMTVVRVTKSKPLPNRKIRLSYVGATDGLYAGVSLALDAPPEIFETQALHIGQPVASIVEELNAFQPDALSGYASGAQMLAHEASEGRLHILPKKIVCSGDPLTKMARASIKDSFGIEPTNLYASTEALSMGSDCALGRLHLYNDWHKFELVDDKGEIVPDGVVGSLVVTNLYNKTMPLIRYHLKDRMSIDPQRCACGSPFPVIKEMEGRPEELLWFQNGDGKRQSVPPIVVDYFVSGVEAFQFEQTSPTAVTVRIVAKGDHKEISEKIEEKTAEMLGEYGLAKTVVTSVEIVDRIMGDKKTGKMRTVIGYSW